MVTKKHQDLLEDFANKSDVLFDLGVISTDSFTGEIGEYIACKHFNLEKSARSNKAVDGICIKGEKYQIKAKVISGSNFTYNLTNLQPALFDKLVVVFFDRFYKPLRLIIVNSNEIQGSTFRLGATNIATFENIETGKIKLAPKIKVAINDFALAYKALEENKIIRSRRIVGDIGEFYACKKLNLLISEKLNEKGIDARDKNGNTFEIKTRRVYESGRRISETRRINNLDGKSADFLVVVIIDRCFICNGMWVMPMKNIINPKSAHLKIVNTTEGVLNIIPSQIAWLNSGKSFKGLEQSSSVTKMKSDKPVSKEIRNLKSSPPKPNQIYGIEKEFFDEKKVALVLFIVIIILFIVGTFNEFY